MSLKQNEYGCACEGGPRRCLCCTKQDEDTLTVEQLGQTLRNLMNHAEYVAVVGSEPNINAGNTTLTVQEAARLWVQSSNVRQTAQFAFSWWPFPPIVEMPSVPKLKPRRRCAVCTGRGRVGKRTCYACRGKG